MVDLTTKLGSLQLENPILVSPGYLTDTESSIKKADERNPGAIVLKTSLINEEYSQLIEPYAFGRYPTIRSKYHVVEGDFIYCDGMSTMSLELWADWLEKNKRKFRTPLIASVMSVSLEGRVKAAKMMEEAGAEAIELLLTCPAPYLHRFNYAAALDPKNNRGGLPGCQESCQNSSGSKGCWHSSFSGCGSIRGRS